MYKFYFIYKTINLINNKIYVGQHKTNNLNDRYLGAGTALQRAVKKYGYKNFKREILEYCDGEIQLDEREKFWISLLNSRNIEVGYNITIGGDNRGNSGYRHSLESIEKMRQKKLGRKLSQESILKRTESRKGFTQTREWCEEQSKRMLGRKLSNESIVKRTKSRSGWHPSEAHRISISQKAKLRKQTNFLLYEESI